MNRYTLTAKLNDSTRKLCFDAEHDERAIFEGSFLVMEHASDRDNWAVSVIWAKGRVELRNPAGELISEMPAKSETCEHAETRWVSIDYETGWRFCNACELRTVVKHAQTA